MTRNPRMAWFTALALIASALALPIGRTVLAAPPDKPAKKDEPRKPGKKPKKKAPLGFKFGPREDSVYEMDAGAEGNEVKFTSKAPKETIIGKSTQIAGKLEANPHKLKDAKGRFAVAWSSVDTGKPMMNQHMTSPPWIDGATHPEIVFELSGIESIKAADKKGNKLRCILAGTFSLNGANKKMKIPATLEYVAPPPTKTKAKPNEGDSSDLPVEGIRIKATFPLGLSDFEISHEGIGKSVAAKLKIDVKLFLPLKPGETESKPDTGGGVKPIKPGPRRPRKPNA